MTRTTQTTIITRWSRERLPRRAFTLANCPVVSVIVIYQARQTRTTLKTLRQSWARTYIKPYIHTYMILPYHLPSINSSIFKAVFINRCLFSFVWLCEISGLFPMIWTVLNVFLIFFFHWHIFTYGLRVCNACEAWWDGVLKLDFTWNAGTVPERLHCR